MTITTVSAVVPAKVKADAEAILSANGISMDAFLREFLARVAVGNKETLAFLDIKKNSRIEWENGK